MPSAARLALAISDGRDDVASIIAEEEIDASVLDDPGIRRAIPMATLVSGKVRAEFETVDLGPCYERGRAAVEALRSLREDGDAGPAAALDWQEPDRFTRCLVPALVLELALAAGENGDRSAEAIAQAMGDTMCCILRNHGLLTGGASPGEAVGWFVTAERVVAVSAVTPVAAMKSTAPWTRWAMAM